MRSAPKFVCFSILMTIGCIVGFIPSSANAQNAGLFGSYIGINANGGGNTWFGAQEWGLDIPNFGGFNFGDINKNTGSLVVSAFQVHTWKANPGDITGATLYYRVFEQGATPGGFNGVSASFLANAPWTGAQGEIARGGGDQNWGRDPGSYADLLGGLTTTGKVYNIEVYFEATSNEGTKFSNNGGANYTATFNLIPEPSSASLMGLATAGLLALRRRRGA